MPGMYPFCLLRVCFCRFLVPLSFLPQLNRSADKGDPVHSWHLTPFLRLLCWLHHGQTSWNQQVAQNLLTWLRSGSVQDVVPRRSRCVQMPNVVAIKPKSNPALLCTAPGCEGTRYFTYGHTLLKCARYIANGLGWFRRC